MTKTFRSMHMLSLMLASTAIMGSLAAPQRRELYRVDAGERRAAALREEQEASELLARDKPKRRQPKHKPQRPNRAQRRHK